MARSPSSSPRIGGPADDAAEAVDVGYEPSRRARRRRRALPGAPLVHPELGTNVAYRSRRAQRRVRPADVVVGLRVVNQRVIPSPMETRAVVADWTRFDAG